MDTQDGKESFARHKHRSSQPLTGSLGLEGLLLLQQGTHPDRGQQINWSPCLLKNSLSSRQARQPEAKLRGWRPSIARECLAGSPLKSAPQTPEQ